MVHSKLIHSKLVLSKLVQSKLVQSMTLYRACSVVTRSRSFQELDLIWTPSSWLCFVRVHVENNNSIYCYDNCNLHKGCTCSVNQRNGNVPCTKVLGHFLLLSQVCKLLKHISGTESLIIWSEHIESIFKCQTAEVRKPVFPHKLNYLVILFAYVISFAA